MARAFIRRADGAPITPEELEAAVLERGGAEFIAPVTRMVMSPAGRVPVTKRARVSLTEHGPWELSLDPDGVLVGRPPPGGLDEDLEAWARRLAEALGAELVQGER